MKPTQLTLVEAGLTNPHALDLFSGESTHDPAMKAVNFMLPHSQDPEFIKGLIESCLPEGYSGDTLREVPEMVESGVKKGLHLNKKAGAYGPGDKGPVPLGYQSNGNFALLDRDRNIIISASPQQLLSGQYLIGLAPSQFWIGQFPTSKGGLNAMAAGEALIQSSKDEGPFNASKIRGRGVWRERGSIVVNLGEHVDQDSEHSYLCFEPLKTHRGAEFDVERLDKLFQKFPWRDPADANLFLGWMVAAVICGALGVRPHLFLYGPPNSGKTTLHDLVRNILTPLCVGADGQSTEAGIRQSIGPDALPVIIDEFETDQNGNRLNSMIRLARSAYSSDSPVLRGTPEGNAMQFNIKTMLMLSAINVVGMAPADATRFLILPLTAHDNDPETGAYIEGERQYFEPLGPDWCGYVVSKADEIIDAIAVFRKVMPLLDSRHRLNIATLLGGAFVALNGCSPTEMEAEDWVETYGETIRRHGQAHERNDPMECLNHLFAHPVRGEEGGDMPLGHWIAKEVAAVQSGQKPDAMRDSQRILAKYEMRIWHRDGSQGVVIRNGSTAIDRVYTGTKWANGSWKRAIEQVPGVFHPANPIRFPGVSNKHRGTGMPLDVIPEAIDDASKHDEF